MKYRNYDDNSIDLSIDEKANSLSTRFFTVKINEKNPTFIDKSIKSKKVKIYDLLKERLLKQKDFIVSRNNNINSLVDTKIKEIKKNIKFTQLYEKIEFGSLGYLNFNPHDGGTKNQKCVNSNIQSLLKSRYFNFRQGFIFGIKNNSNMKKKKINKSILLNSNLNKIDNKFNDKEDRKNIDNKENEKNIDNKFNDKENEKKIDNYFNTETSEILNDNNYDIHNSSKNNIKELSKDFSFNSDSITPKKKLIIAINKISKNENKIKKNSQFNIKKIKTSSNIKTIKKDKLVKLNISQNSYSENNYNENKKNINLEKGKNKINLYRKTSLNNLILNCIDNDKTKVNNKKFSKIKKNRRNKTKYNYTSRKSLYSKNKEKIFKNFHKYITLIDKGKNNNSKNNENKNIQKNNFINQDKELEKKLLIKKNFCRFGSKTISSLANTINIEQTKLNNKLFKIIDRANFTVKKEKQIDKVLEIILEKKIIKKKKTKAKEIFVDASDGKKLLDERNKLRFMMRFADLIKDMNDEMALNLTKNIIENNEILKKEFILPELTEYKKLRKLKYLERQKNIRKRLLQKIGEIETQFLINEIEKDNLYTKYEKIFQKNQMLKDINKYYNINNVKEEIKKYHNIDFISNNFQQYINK